MFNVPSSLRCTHSVMFYSPVAGAYCNKGVSVVQTEGQSPGPTSAPEGPALLCELPIGSGLSAFMSSLSGSCELFFFRGCQTNARLRTTGGARCRTGGPGGRRMPPRGRSRPFREWSRIRDCARLRLSALRFWKGSSLSAGEEPFRHLYAQRRAVSVPRLTYFNVSLHRSHARGVVAPMKRSILRARLLVGQIRLQKGFFSAHLPFRGQREGITSQARASISLYAMKGREKHSSERLHSREILLA